MINANSCEILDRSVNNACDLRFSLSRRGLFQFSLAQFIAVFLAKRVVAGLAQGLPDMVYHVAKRAFAGAIADKPFIVFELNIILDIDERQTIGAVRATAGAASVSSHLTSPRIR